MNSSKNMVRIQNAQDRRGADGKWLKFYTEEGVGYATRASVVWFNMKARCEDTRAYKARNAAYADTQNGFESFQHFAEWCQGEYGYRKRERNGFFWSLDKDLISIGNRVYSEDRCMFIPNRVNILFSGTRIEREYPMGVCYYKPLNKLRSQSHSANGTKTHLGYFDCPEEAHLAYQKHKIEVFKLLLKDDEDVMNHEKLRLSIEHLMSIYENDVLHGRETKFY
jgi:hypothetical protein